jgi:transposase, IS30 family
MFPPRCVGCVPMVFGQTGGAISIREGPADIEDRAIPGHWEGDLIGGTHNSHIAILVERHSRFTALVKVRSKDTVTWDSQGVPNFAAR